MGADIWLFCEVCTVESGEKVWFPEELEGWDDPRDYELFYLLGGIRGYENSSQDTYPPIAPCKGLPGDLNPMTVNDDRTSLEVAEAVSYYTLKELKASPYSGIMRIKGWVDEDEFRRYNPGAPIRRGLGQHFDWVHPDAPPWKHEGLVLREWNGILNGNLNFLVRQMEKIKTDRQIYSDESIRIVFWIA